VSIHKKKLTHTHTHTHTLSLKNVLDALLDPASSVVYNIFTPIEYRPLSLKNVLDAQLDPASSVVYNILTPIEYRALHPHPCVYVHGGGVGATVLDVDPMLAIGLLHMLVVRSFHVFSFCNRRLKKNVGDNKRSNTQAKK
jgi:hypothetical protein